MSGAKKIRVARIALLFGFVSLFMAPAALRAQAGVGSEADPPPESSAAPYDFKNEGIFGCNQVSGASASAGTMAAIGGVYVPVNDAAVTLNTGILVYKECVLKPLQDRLRESALSSLWRKNYVGVETGREGNKRYVVQRKTEREAVADKALLSVLTDEKVLEKLSPEFKDTVRSSIARGWRAGREPQSQLECSYKGNVGETLKGKVPAEGGGTPNMLDALTVLKDPACNPMGAYALVARISTDRVTQAVKDWETTIQEGGGFYPVTDNASDPLAEKILTPASVVRNSFQTVLDSPVHQLEQADDVGEIIGALFAGITTQALTDTRGLAGLGQGTAGRPSYLDQVSRESSQGVIGAAVNAALTILGSARQTEANFLSAMNAIASALTQTISQLRQGETACWALVVPKVREHASVNGITLDEAKIRAATSSLAFAQQVIDAQVTPLANVALTNVQSSQKALGLIDQLIAGVTNTASISAQRLALQQLDTLVAQRALHTQYDVNRANQQREDVTAAMATLVPDTLKAWADSPDASVGWCNIRNSSVIEQWAERWKR